MVVDVIVVPVVVSAVVLAIIMPAVIVRSSLCLVIYCGGRSLHCHAPSCIAVRTAVLAAMLAVVATLSPLKMEESKMAKSGDSTTKILGSPPPIFPHRPRLTLWSLLFPTTPLLFLE